MAVCVLSRDWLDEITLMLVLFNTVTAKLLCKVTIRSTCLSTVLYLDIHEHYFTVFCSRPLRRYQTVGLYLPNKMILVKELGNTEIKRLLIGNFTKILMMITKRLITDNMLYFGVISFQYQVNINNYKYDPKEITLHTSSYRVFPF